jgi:hypothetical protein
LKIKAPNLASMLEACRTTPSLLQGMTFAACWWRLWLLASFTWIMVFSFLCLSFGDYLF